jgi:pseudouridine-5'-phosphate glycosidase
MLRRDTIELTLEVELALQEKRPILALESTIISHGLPWPQNLHCAKLWNDLVREHGVVPAPIAVIDGKIKVGLSPDELLFLAERGPELAKLSSFDLAWAQAKKLSGSTTVAGTISIAHAVGIAVFSTGGIGGVHRGAEETWDISHDLETMAHTPIIVVSAGAKAILDLPKTLEYLETKGVLVLGWRTSQFPAFYYQDSGLELQYQTENVSIIAETLRMKPKGAILVANPIPKEAEIPRARIEPAIQQALEKAKALKISGKALTPFLLDSLRIETGEESVKANLALIRNNIELACKIALALRV